MLLAIGIVALIAALGYRALAALSESETRLTAEATRWRTLDLFFARLEADLRQAMPRPARLSDVVAPALLASADASGNSLLEFSRAGPEFALEPGSAGQRLAYRLRDGSIEVLYWASYDRPSGLEPTAYALLRRRHSLPDRLPHPVRSLGRQLAGDRRGSATAGGEGRLDPGLGRSDRAMARPALAARGAAIVMAMLLAALAATIAAALLWQQQRWAGEYERRRDQVQAQALALAGVQWARQILFENAPAASVNLRQPWAFHLPTTPIENGSIGGYITDAQSGLNVNNLAFGGTVATAAQADLSRLFAELGVPNTLLSAIIDWVDADNEVTPNGGAEDGYYLAQDPPGLAANAPVRRIAELLAVRGADPAIIARLAPFIDALDAPTVVNVNTAPAEVLVAVDPRARSGRRGGAHRQPRHRPVQQPQ